MSSLREAAQQALEAIESDTVKFSAWTEKMLAAQTALRAALAEPQTTHWQGCEEVHPECRKPEPVGYWDGEFSTNGGATLYEVPQVSLFGRTYPNIPVYAAPTPRQWVSLTDQEMYDLFFNDQYGPRLPEYLVNTIKCVEAALKEKNGG